MKKNKKKILIICGGFCILIMIISSLYAILFNDSRLVTPTDFRSYIFHVKDLPMIISGFLTFIYVLTLFIIIVKQKNKTNNKNITRKINPKLGFLGLFGFLGFFGFQTFSSNGSVYPFIFFLFFGFFGFFFEGKMSETFMDERFHENAANAQQKSYKITFSITFVALIILCQGKLLGSYEYTLIAAIITLSLTLALGIFLPEYLLYRYDYNEEIEQSEE